MYNVASCWLYLEEFPKYSALKSLRSFIPKALYYQKVVKSDFHNTYAHIGPTDFKSWSHGEYHIWLTSIRYVRSISSKILQENFAKKFKLSIPRTIYLLPYWVFFRSTKRNTETPAVYWVVPKTFKNQRDKSLFPFCIKYSLRRKHLK